MGKPSLADAIFGKFSKNPTSWVRTCTKRYPSHQTPTTLNRKKYSKEISHIYRMSLQFRYKLLNWYFNCNWSITALHFFSVSQTSGAPFWWSSMTSWPSGQVWSNWASCQTHIQSISIQSAFIIVMFTSQRSWFIQSIFNPISSHSVQILVGGDWNHGILNDFPFSWE